MCRRLDYPEWIPSGSDFLLCRPPLAQGVSADVVRVLVFWPGATQCTAHGGCGPHAQTCG